jgi:hypothetical protein
MDATFSECCFLLEPGGIAADEVLPPLLKQQTWLAWEYDWSNGCLSLSAGV